MWDWNAYLHNLYLDSNVRLSLGFRQGLSYGFSYSMSTNNWQTIMNYSSETSTSSQAFAAEYDAVLVAPYTGYYTFYANGDDSITVSGSLYDAQNGYGPETQLIRVPLYTSPGDFITYAAINHSPRISLTRGSRYKLRVSLINNIRQDNMEVAMRVDPVYDSATGYLLDGLNSVNNQDTNLPPEVLLQENTVPLTFSPTFLHHHALRDVQIVSVNALLQKEVQVMRI